MKNRLKKLAEKIYLFFNKNACDGEKVLLERRQILSQDLDKKLGSVVRYGPLKGLKFTSNTYWAGADRGAMLLGLYELEVLNTFKDIPSKYNTFINVGAADGYYGVGVLVGNLFSKSICYEISKAGRETIKENASLNGASERVEIRGAANKDFYKDIDKAILDYSVLLIDIEGGEFEIVNKETFEAFKKSIIIIELHEWSISEGKIELEKMLNDSQSTHRVTEFRSGPRDPASFEELKMYSDTDRWLICSEGRPEVMRWWRFDPK
jgi:hypothetical protein